jgi:hypothetical protein
VITSSSGKLLEPLQLERIVREEAARLLLRHARRSKGMSAFATSAIFCSNASRSSGVNGASTSKS